VQRRLKVLFPAVAIVISSLPLVDFDPDQLPEAEQEVASDELHDNVTVPPTSVDRMSLTKDVIDVRICLAPPPPPPPPPPQDAKTMTDKTIKLFFNASIEILKKMVWILILHKKNVFV
jgi:hypothetical protein